MTYPKPGLQPQLVSDWIDLSRDLFFGALIVAPTTSVEEWTDFSYSKIKNPGSIAKHEKSVSFIYLSSFDLELFARCIIEKQPDLIRCLFLAMSFQLLLWFRDP